MLLGSNFKSKRARVFRRTQFICDSADRQRVASTARGRSRLIMASSLALKKSVVAIGNKTSKTPRRRRRAYRPHKTRSNVESLSWSTGSGSIQSEFFTYPGDLREKVKRGYSDLARRAIVRANHSARADRSPCSGFRGWGYGGVAYWQEI